MSNITGKKLGNYRINAPLGQGGMATVYRATQESMERDVAIKVIETNEHTDKDFTERFRREAKTIASLSHPHIIKVFDYGTQENYAYLVMELLPGGTLSKLMKKGAFPIRAVYRVLQQLVEALDYAHVKSIIHRDLKPQNVLLDENRNVILTDFGIARLWQRFPINLASLTEKVAGTPAYMAPEQWRNEELTPRTDIYALGIMTFEMLAGRLPFSGSAKTLMYLHTYHTPPPIRTIRPDVPEAIERVVLQSIAKDPAQRYDTAGDYLVAFRKALEGDSTPLFIDETVDAQATNLFDTSMLRSDSMNSFNLDSDIWQLVKSSNQMPKSEAPPAEPAPPVEPAASSTATNLNMGSMKPRVLRKVSVGEIRKLSDDSSMRRPPSANGAQAAQVAPAMPAPAQAPVPPPPPPAYAPVRPITDDLPPMAINPAAKPMPAKSGSNSKRKKKSSKGKASSGISGVSPSTLVWIGIGFVIFVVLVALIAILVMQ
ncbi:MAG: serine/threonine protein kinase [Anaerolineae bacterium]|nr:serine/threonine protein kinase [Anaerolineae bacterium]